MVFSWLSYFFALLVAHSTTATTTPAYSCSHTTTIYRCTATTTIRLVLKGCLLGGMKREQPSQWEMEWATRVSVA